MAETFSREQISHVLNEVADDIREAADLPDSGAIDALNLMVNAALVAFDHDGQLQPLDKVVDDKYDGADLVEVIGWINDR